MDIIQQSQKIYDVIILGAGIAGIGAANYLQQNNISYLVLQAQDKIGGRIQNYKISGVEIDIGAYQLPGYIPGNPVYQFMKKYNWQVQLSKNDNETIYIDQYQGKLQNEAVQKIQQLFDQIIQQYQKFSKQKKRQYIQISLQDFLKPYLQKYKQTLSKSQFRLFNLFINMMQQQDAGSMQTLSTLIFGFDQEEQMQMDSYALPKGTYANLVKKMGENINVKLKQKVTQVKYSNEFCTVKTQKNIYSSKFVICALPLGVLKKKIIKFQPQFPEFKNKIIQKIGFGNFNKILLSFDKPFWNKNVSRMKFACDQRGKYSHFFNMSQNEAHILCCFVAGDFCKKLNLMNDQQIFKDVVNFLKKQMKDQQISLKQGFYTRWEKNQFELGGFSHFTVGMDVDDLIKMRENINNKIWLTGEYLYLQNMGTAHGACITGINASKQIVQLLNKI